MDPELWEMLEEGDSEDEVAAIIRLGQPGIVPPGVRVIAQFGEIVTVRIIKRGSILDIREEAEVASFKAQGPPYGPDVELDDTELLEGSPEAIQPSDERRPPLLDATGRDVVVGIVDWGLDFVHPDFRNPDGSTRILALWDQRGRPRTESPQPYGYGLVHTREEINRALRQAIRMRRWATIPLMLTWDAAPTARWSRASRQAMAGVVARSGLHPRQR